MHSKTRYFAITSLLVLTVGLGTGLLAYYVGFPTSAFAGANTLEEFQLVPSDASLVAYADVREIMASPLRQKARTLFPMKEDGQREFESQTGINIETDIDRVVAAISPTLAGGTGSNPVQGSALLLARGRFNESKIEALMREHGAQVEQYKGKRVIIAPIEKNAPGISLAFLQPGFASIGTTNLIKAAIDRQSGSGANMTSNTELMSLVADLDSANAWAVGRFDTLTNQAQLPAQISQGLPALTWVSASVKVGTGVQGVVRAHAKDEAAANNLRDVVRGIVALAKLQASSRPEVQTAISSLALGGTGQTVALSFDLPGEMFDALSGAFIGRGAQPAR